MVRVVPAALTVNGAVIPPPFGASGMLYRTVIASAALGRVNSTYWPGVRRTAERPEASAGRVYAARPGPITAPLVAAFSASCSANGTVAPRPATSAGSRAARVTAGPAAVVRGAASAVPATPSTMLRPTAEAVATVAQRGGALV